MSNDKTLDEARTDVFEGMRTAAGIICPCCDQKAKLYPRALNSGMVKILISMHQATPNLSDPWLHVSKHFLAHKQNAVAQEYSKLRFWGLIEQQEDDEGNHVPGVWKVTEKGQEFVRDECEVPRIAYVFNNTVFGFSKDTTNIQKALTDKFSYTELMAAA